MAVKSFEPNFKIKTSGLEFLTVLQSGVFDCLAVKKSSLGYGLATNSTKTDGAGIAEAQVSCASNVFTLAKKGLKTVDKRSAP